MGKILIEMDDEEHRLLRMWSKQEGVSMASVILDAYYEKRSTPKRRKKLIKKESKRRGNVIEKINVLLGDLQ